MNHHPRGLPGKKPKSGDRHSDESAVLLIRGGGGNILKKSDSTHTQGKKSNDIAEADKGELGMRYIAS